MTSILKIFIVLILLANLSCSKKNNPLLGKWKMIGSPLELEITKDSLIWQVQNTPPFLQAYELDNKSIISRNAITKDTIQIIFNDSDSLVLILKEKGMMKQKNFVRSK